MTSSTTLTPRRFALRLLRGAAQVCFVDDARAGACFVAAVFVGSCVAAAFALVGVVVGSVVGAFVDDEGNDAGRNGFNGFLVGAAAATFRAPSLWLLLAVVVAAAVATLLSIGARRLRVSVFTAPFLVVTWALLLLPLPVAGDTWAWSWAQATPLVFAPLAGIAQVFLQSHVVAGVLVVVGLQLGRSSFAALALVTAVFCAGLGALFLPSHDVARGLCGYDGVLGALGFAVVADVRVSAPVFARAVFFGVACAVVGACAARAFAFVSLPPLTTGFVVTTSALALLQRTRSPETKTAAQP